MMAMRVIWMMQMQLKAISLPIHDYIDLLAMSVRAIVKEKRDRSVRRNRNDKLTIALPTLECFRIRLACRSTSHALGKQFAGLLVTLPGRLHYSHPRPRRCEPTMVIQSNGRFLPGCGRRYSDVEQHHLRLMIDDYREESGDGARHIPIFVAGFD